MQLSPIVLSRELKRKFGGVQLAQTLRGQNFLIVVKTNEQKNKVLNAEITCKKTMGEKKLLGESKMTWG